MSSLRVAEQLSPPWRDDSLPVLFRLRASAGNDFSLWGLTGTIEVMPTDFFSIRPELMYRRANVPFFAGPGGTTSATGFVDGSTAGFVPDVRKEQLLAVLGVSFRL